MAHIHHPVEIFYDYSFFLDCAEVEGESTMTNSTVFIQCNTSSSASLLPSSKMPSPPNANIRQQQPPPPQSTPSLFFQIHRNYLCQIVELLRTNTIMQPKLSTTSTIKNRSIQSQGKLVTPPPTKPEDKPRCGLRKYTKPEVYFRGCVPLSRKEVKHSVFDQREKKTFYDLPSVNQFVCLINR